MTETPEYARRLVFRDGEVEALTDRLFHITEELAAGTLSSSVGGARGRVAAVLDALEYATGDLEAIAIRAGVLPGFEMPEGGRQGYRGVPGSGAVGKTGLMPDPDQVAAALRSIVDGVRDAPDTTADPVQLAYLRGWADALDHLAERDRPDVNESGHVSRDATGEA